MVLLHTGALRTRVSSIAIWEQQCDEKDMLVMNGRIVPGLLGLVPGSPGGRGQWIEQGSAVNSKDLVLVMRLLVI